jgi:hypothetical protein
MVRWIVFLHIAGIFGFLLSHGSSAGVVFALRHERKPERIRALLQLSGSARPAGAAGGHRVWGCDGDRRADVVQAVLRKAEAFGLTVPRGVLVGPAAQGDSAPQWRSTCPCSTVPNSF